MATTNTTTKAPRHQDRDDGRVGPLRRALDTWARDIPQDAPGWWRAVFRTMRGSWLSVPLIVVHLCFVVHDLLRAASLEQANVMIRVYVGSHSSLAAQVMWLCRLRHVERALGLLRLVAGQLEAADGSPGTASVARRIHRIKVFFLWFTVGTVSSVAFTLIGQVSWRDTAALAKAVLMSTACGCCIPSYYYMLPLMLSANLARAALFRELGVRAEERGGSSETVRVAALHAALLEAGRQMEQLVGALFPQYLMTAVVMPLVCTSEVIQAHGQTDLFALSSVSVLFLVFVSQCLVGQMLHDCSDALSAQCYFGPWLTERPADRRARLMVMLLAKRPQVVPVKGLGKLNRPSCVSVVKTWFSYLQVLLRFSS